MEKILVINPGSTSTKIAVYEDDRQLFVNSIEHADEEIEKYDAIYDQYEFRKKLVLEELEKNGVKASELTCVMSRGGLLPPVPAGAIRVNQDIRSMNMRLIWARLSHSPLRRKTIFRHLSTTR